MSTAIATLGPTAAAANYAAELDPGSIPAATLVRTKQALLDLLGIAIRARFDAESSLALGRAVAVLGRSGDARAIGHAERYAAHYAAFLNAAYAHTLDFDDTHQDGSIHPGAPVIPAVLAVADEVGASGLAVLGAIVAGYDITVRLSQALDPGAQYARGFHPSAVCGAFGAAAAVANLNRDSAELIENAFGLVGSFAAGSQQFLDTGGWNKRVHVGYAAHNGIVAYHLARAGVQGAPSAFEGKYGAFVNFSGRAQPERLIAGLRRGHAVDETATKPYPCCRYAHAPLDALLEILNEQDLRAEEIEHIQVRIPTIPMELIVEPAERKRAPRTIVDGQFSMFFLAAAAAVRRGFRWGDYELLGSDEVERLIARTDVVADPELDRSGLRMPGGVVVTARGRSWTRRCDVPSGEPEKALNWGALIDKFNSLAEPAYDQNRRSLIVAAVRDLERVGDTRKLTELLGP